MRIFVSSADASGDLHAAALLQSLRRRIDFEAFGIGGEAMQTLGVEALVPPSALALGGLVEVVSSLPRALSAYAQLRRALKTKKPDIALLVDSPDLNLPLASVASRSGIPVLYYIAPQFWAWRAGRVRKIRRRVRHVGVIFPFEETLLREAGIPATFVGHPLVDRMTRLKAELDRAETASELGVDLAKPILGLLPGSRRNELRDNLPVMLETAALLSRARPDLQVILLLAPTLDATGIEVPRNVRLVWGRTHAGMSISTALLAAPGTVTVEAALLGVPHVVAVRGNQLSFEVLRRITRVRSSVMMNLVANEALIPECIQHVARPARIAALLAPLLENSPTRAKMLAGLERAVAKLGPPGASERVADLLLEVAKGG